MFGFLYPQIRRYVATWTFFFSTIKTRIRSRVQNFFSTSLLEETPSKPNLTNLNSPKVAIVALFPRPALLKSVIRLITAFELSGYRVVLVVNESFMAVEWCEQLQSPDRTLLLRRNFGRDFGAYKEGFLYLEKSGLLSRVTKLAFANDSVFYGEKSIACIKEYLDRDLPWNSLFVNYQIHIHSQSFMQVFDSTIFQRPYFSDFWNNYFPSELRHLAINNGEVRLTEETILEGFSPNPYITAERILTSSNFGQFSQDENFALWSTMGMALYDKNINTVDNSILRLKRIFIENNATHHAGLLASRVLGSPLKLDILQTGQATPSAIKETLTSMGCEEMEISEIVSAMSLNGTHVSNKGLKRLWKNYGYV
jgi:hypothetical protein